MRERDSLQPGNHAQGTLCHLLLSSLVRASEDEKLKHFKSSEDGTKGLNSSEVLGNIFAINVAGHDTTANTLAYSMLLLAAYPEVQDWVGKELREILPHPSSETWFCGEVFSRLKRCQAVLVSPILCVNVWKRHLVTTRYQLETIRLFTPVIALPKYTNQQPQQPKLGNKTITIDPETMVVPYLLATHTHPSYWGPDPLIWRPSRWIFSHSSTSKRSDLGLSECLESEELFVPTQGSYFPGRTARRIVLARSFRR